VVFCRPTSFENIFDAITEGCRRSLKNDGFIISNILKREVSKI
jgi:hypothetical protein